MTGEVCPPCNAAEQLALEQSLFDSLPRAQACLRIWQPSPALVVTTAESTLPAFAAAAAQAVNRGLQVHVRRTGGGAVCLGPGMLVVTHLFTTWKNAVDDSYREFAEVLIRAVSRLGIALDTGQVTAAYCDGKFDLAWRGLKVGGIAQRRRMIGGMVHVWIHAVIAVDKSCRHYPRAVAEFYSDLGSSRRADPLSTTSLAECLPPRAAAADLLMCCATTISAEFAESAGTAPAGATATSYPRYPPRFAG